MLNSKNFAPKGDIMSARKQQRKAAILTLFVFLLPVLIILLGFCIDMSYMQLVRTEMQLATDNAVRAATDHFARFEDQAAAIAEGERMASEFTVAGRQLTLRDSDFAFGRATVDNNGVYVFDPTGTPLNAVRVNATRDSASPDGSVGLFFSQFIGRSAYEPSSSSTAAFVNVDICLVLDRSSSMKLQVVTSQTYLSSRDDRWCEPPESGSRWLALEAGVQEFVGVLQSNTVDELVSIVTYGSNISNDFGYSVCGSEPIATLDLGLTSDLSAVTDEVANRSSEVWNGNTLIANGIALAHTELLSGVGARQHSEKVMIVLTDGNPTGGDAVAAAAAASAAGIRVYTITFSTAANQSHMQAVATAGGGRHEHAADGATLNDIFREFAAAATRLVE